MQENLELTWEDWYLILPMAVLGPVLTTTALALPAVTTVPCAPVATQQL